MRYVIAAIVIGLFLWVSAEGVKDAEREQEMYCKMVKEGVWPAYKGTDVCK